jgi:hypothetical protein
MFSKDSFLTAFQDSSVWYKPYASGFYKVFFTVIRDSNIWYNINFITVFPCHFICSEKIFIKS